MYKDVAQYAAASEAGVGEIDAITQFAANDGLKTRDRPEVKIATLEMMVR